MSKIVKCSNNQKSMICLLVMMISICVVVANSSHNQNTISQQQSFYKNRSQLSTTNQQQISSFIMIDQISETKLLSIQRQIVMNQQMVKLYQQRLQLLYLLRKQIKDQLVVKRDKQYGGKNVDIINGQQQHVMMDRIKYSSLQLSNDKDDNNNKKHNIYNNVKQHSSQQKQHYQDNPFYILINQYQITTKSQHQTISTSSLYKKLDQHLVLLPPFVINIQQSYVTLINQLDHFQSDNLLSQQQQSNYQQIKAYYDFSHASRLLFYSLQKGYNKQRSNNQKYSQPYYYQQQPHSLQLTLQIKPNKIKIVKITPILIKINQTSSSQTSKSQFKNIFQIEQQVTSYQSHPLINKNFKWHNALQFDNLIIGFNDKKIYIKGKDKKMQEINVYQKILGLYSINQYKVVYVTQKRVGIINVRSYLLTDQIRFQYYLGNRTLVKKQKQSQQQQQQQQQQQHLQQQMNILFNNQINHNNKSTNSKPYWHASNSKQFKQINAVSIQRLQRTNQVLILLSNGDLLMYGNNKISTSVNIGGQVMKEFGWYERVSDDVGDDKGDKVGGDNADQNQNKQKQDSSTDSKDYDDMKISMQILPGYNHAILTSTKHNKILIYNITIPHLTLNKNSNFFAFLSPKVQQLSCQYWMSVQMNKLKKRDSQNIGGDRQSNKMNRYSINDIQVFVRQKNYQQSFGEVAYSGNNMGKQVIVYFAYYLSSLDKMKSNNPQNQQQSSSSSSLTTTTTIQQHRLLLNLLQNNYITSNTTNNNSSQTKSYWWNVLMVCMIVVGVVVFKKCKQSNKQKSKQQQMDQLYQLPEGYKMGKSMKSNDNNKLLTTGRFTKDNKINKPIIRQQQQFISTQQYEDKVITQLQLYLQKQGQKLTKEQISQLIQQMEAKQEQDQGEIMRPKMRRQTSGDGEQQYGKEQMMQLSSMRKIDNKRLILQKQRKQIIKIDSLQKKKKKRQ